MMKSLNVYTKKKNDLFNTIAFKLTLSSYVRKKNKNVGNNLTFIGPSKNDWTSS